MPIPLTTSRVAPLWRTPEAKLKPFIGPDWKV